MADVFGESLFNDKVTAYNGLETTDITTKTVTSQDLRSSGSSNLNNLNVVGVSTLQDINLRNASASNLVVSGISTASNLVVSDISTLGNTVVGGATTQLVVNGNTRITGILTVGNSSVTINGSTNTISGISSVTDDIGGYVSIPPGAVQFFARNSAPSGWLKANGASLNTTTYSSLFSAIGYTFGGGGASFNIPDLRGEFIRVWDDSRGVDSGRSFATSQSEMINQHRHWVSAAAIDDRNFTGSGGNTQDLGLVSDAGSYSSTDPNSAAGRYTRNDPGFGSNTETRPRNIALLACIKY